MTKEELEKKMDELDDAIHELWDSVTDDESWKRYKESPLHTEYRKLSQQYRKIRDYKLEEKVPSYGDHMTLKKFVDSCLGGGFCNSDGFGNYATKEMMSDVEVYPSDIIAGVYRDDFDYVVWLNN
jgi:hypothetical protein